MKLVFLLAALAASLFNVTLYASGKPLLDEEIKSLKKSNIQTFVPQTDEEVFQTSKVAAFSKWDIVQQDLWKLYIDRSKAAQERNPGQKPIDLMAIIDRYTYHGDNMKEFSENVRGGLRLYKTDYLEYLWARCNQVKRAASERGGINAMKKENPEAYKQLIKDILRQPIEFIEAPTQK